MGLQDKLVMSVVPTHDVFRARAPPATMPSTSSIQDGNSSTLVETFQALAVKDKFPNIPINNHPNNNHKHDEVISSNTTTEHKNSTGNLDPGSGGDYDGVIDDDSGQSDVSESQTDEVRLSRALHSWMSDYVITPLPRQGHTFRQPVFSARLGRESNIRRTSSSESIDTQLSLFSCSSHGSRKSREKKRRRFRRRKAISAETDEDLKAKPSSAPSGGQGSIWVELARRTRGELDKFMMGQSHALSQGFNLMTESEAFQHCDPDEQKALYQCGKRNKLALGTRLRKTSSMANLSQTASDAQKKKKKKRRVASAGAKTFFGKPLDFQELRCQMFNKRLSALSSWHRLRSSAPTRSLHRSLSKNSLNSVGSGDVFLSTTTPHSVTPPPLSPSEGGGSAGEGGAERRRLQARRASQMSQRKKSVIMWKGDSEILAIDLKRELTTKVKRRIAITTTALERVTGLGDNNEQKADYTCHLREFPAYVDEDYGQRPKISQKIRISPHLSDVIKSDIRVRMGRPRYHEIREQDLQVWNRGQTLDRSHRNLKVFNWLHSLKEEEFDQVSLRQSVCDAPPVPDDVPFGEMVLIHAVNDPDVKPLFQHSKTYVR